MAESLAVLNPTIQQLRQQLRERFPHAHGGPVMSENPPSIAPVFPDSACFPKGGISEISPIGPDVGMGLILASMLDHEASPGLIPALALIDGRDQFDPGSFAPHLCAKLLWVRCVSPEQSLKAADLLLRDGNLPRVVLDMLGYPCREIASIRTSVWHRFKHWIESNDSVLIALTPRPIVPCAAIRFGLHSKIGLDHLSRSNCDLLRQIQVTPVLQQRVAR